LKVEKKEEKKVAKKEAKKKAGYSKESAEVEKYIHEGEDEKPADPIPETPI